MEHVIFDRKGGTLAQGDITLIATDELPPNLVEVAPDNGRLIVAHSETGHHHLVNAAEARFYSDPKQPFICYLVVSEKFTDLVHARDVNPHTTVRLPCGTYKVHRQREWTPEGWRAVQD